MTAIAQYIDFPYHVDARGHTGAAAHGDHVRNLIRQVLFTAPGERVNRPDFGCGVRQMVFMPNRDVLATASQFLIHGALVRWLDTVISVERVAVHSFDERLEITVVYRLRTTGELRADRFTAPGGLAS